MKLKKIRLVNWHIFNDHTITINNNTVLTGENGHGKSTLIDAIYFVLSGGDEKSFNNAANAESARTLQTYIRCKLGIEGKEFKRNETDIVGHIALEFYDSVKKTTKTLGCVIELFGTKGINKYFYILNGLGVDDIKYVDENHVVADYDTFKEQCKDHIDAMPPRTPLRTIRTKIEDLLQLSNSDSYNKLLKKAIVFKPLNNEITSFVNQFLLKENNIDIASMKSEIDSYKKVEELVKSHRKKLDYLEEFIGKANDYYENKKKLDYLTAVQYKKIANNAEAIVLKRNEELVKVNARIAAAEKDFNTYQENIDSYKDALSELKNQDEYKFLKELDKQLSDNERNLMYARNAQRDAEKLLDNEQSISDSLGLNYNFTKFIEKNDIQGLNVAIIKYLNTIIKIKEEKTEVRYEKNRIYGDNKRNLEELNATINKLKKGQNTYKTPVTNLINILNSKLSEKYNKEIKTLPLCECFEITDKRWANAIEGYLHNQRFDLVVEGRFFKNALHIYEDYAEAKGIYEVGLIDTTKVIDLPVKENSLFTKIRIKNPLVETKLKQLLGGVVCVETIDDLNKYDAAMTSTCMLYKNFVAKRLNPQRYETHYIGQESQAQRIAQLTAKYEQLKDQNENLNDEITELSNIISRVGDVKVSKNTLIENVWENVSELEAKGNDIKQQIADQKNKSILLDLDSTIEKYEKMVFEETKKRNSANEARNFASDEKSKIDNAIEIYTKQYNDYHEKYIAEIGANSLGEEYLKYEEKVLSLKSLDIEDEKAKIEADSKLNKKIIEKGIQKYYLECDDKALGASIDDLDKYIAKYNQIKNTDIVIYEQEANKTYENAKHTFDTNFVAVLRERINNAIASLNDINKILVQHPFGQDGERYTFTHTASSDKELGKYYKIITSNKTYDQGDLFSEAMSTEDQESIKELFENIANAENNSDAQRKIETFLDYRNYMNYDIKITNNNNDIAYFSKIAREKSGGETQTPFYVVIAACFEQLIKKNAYGSSCIIIFDEAFNNMDESHISTLLEYYKQLDQIQFIIGIPSNRAPLLIPNMDSCIGLVKKNNTVDFYDVE